MFELQSLPRVRLKGTTGYSGEAARKKFSRGSAPRQKPEPALGQNSRRECPAVSMETSVTLQLSVLSRLNSEGRNKSKMT